MYGSTFVLPYFLKYRCNRCSPTCPLQVKYCTEAGLRKYESTIARTCTVQRTANFHFRTVVLTYLRIIRKYESTTTSEIADFASAHTFKNVLSYYAQTICSYAHPLYSIPIYFAVLGSRELETTVSFVRTSVIAIRAWVQLRKQNTSVPSRDFRKYKMYESTSVIVHSSTRTCSSQLPSYNALQRYKYNGTCM